MSTKNKTKNLKLPQYQNDDLFDMKEVNEAYKIIDESYKEQNDNYKQAIETSTINGAIDNLELIDARKGKRTLGEKISEIDEKLETIEKKQDWFSEEFKGNTFVAHRGYSNQYPENTLKSYYEASKVGFKAWECDPWYSTDGVWFNMHDTTVDRTTDGIGNTDSFSWTELNEMNIDHGNNITQKLVLA